MTHSRRDSGTPSDGRAHSRAPESPHGPGVEAAPDEPNDIDIALMVRAQAEDLEAFEELFRRYERPLFAYFVRLSRDRAGAEDGVQEVFIRVWQARHRYAPTGRFSSYVFRIARNYWLNELKRRSVRPVIYAPDDELPPAIETAPDAQPVQALAQRELGVQLEQALDQLPIEQREVFLLARFHRMPYREIATLMDIPVRTVESRLVLATRKLLGLLASYVRLDTQ